MAGKMPTPLDGRQDAYPFMYIAAPYGGILYDPSSLPDLVLSFTDFGGDHREMPKLFSFLLDKSRYFVHPKALS